MKKAAVAPPAPPHTVTQNQGRFKPRSWETYTWEELHWWVRLLCKRAGNRTEPAKCQKDVCDAQSYLAMAQARLTHLTGLARPDVDALLDAETGESHVAAMIATLERTLAGLASPQPEPAP